jgi:protease-4
MRFLSTLAASVLGTLIALGTLVALLFLFVFALALSGSSQPQVQPNSILTVELEGDVPEKTADDPFAEAFAQGASYDLLDLKQALSMAAADDRIEGVWLRVRNTTAGWGTLKEVRRALVEYKESGKPLLASSADHAMDERTYYVASAADSVFAAPVTAFEFNGFRTTVSFFQGALQKLNIEPNVIRAGKYKSAVEPFLRDDLSEPNSTQLSALLETVNDEFMETVATARDLSRETLDRLASESAVLSTEAAVEAGLLDGLRYREEMTDTFRDRLAFAPGDDLPTVDVSTYSRIPPSSAGMEAAGSGEIAVVYATGQIVPGASSDDDNAIGTMATVGSATFADAMEEARSRSGVEAIVVRVNSPGGSAAASESMWRSVHRAAGTKPVVVSMGDAAASGGYYLAAGTDQIVAEPTTTTGSIGVFRVQFNTRDLFSEKLGVTFDGIQTSPLADINSSVRPLSERERRLLGAAVDSTYQTFLRRVGEARGMSAAAVDEVAQGRVWSGVDAKEVGLVDSLGGIDLAIRMAAEEAGMGEGPFNLRVLPRPKTFVQRLNDALYTRAQALWQRSTRSDAERLFLEQRRFLHRLSQTHGTTQARLPFDITIQ